MLDEHPEWKLLKKRLPSKGSRFLSIELILRFFSLHERVSKYGGNQPKFLNDYIREMRFAKATIVKKQEKLFHEVVSEISRGAAQLGAFAMSYTLLEASMIGVAHNLNHVSTINSVDLGKRIVKLSESYELDSAEAKVGTTKASNVRDRVRKAREIFAD